MTKGTRAILGTAIVATALALAVSTPAATQTTCDGELAPGSYTRLVVPAGAVCTGAGFVSINGGVWIGEGATYLLGSEETPDATSRINGGVHATDAMNVQIHFAAINGGIDIHGGSGPFGGPFGVTWITIEDSTINGRVTIEGYNGFWMGFIRNTVNGTVNLNDNVLVDPDANEYVTNRINGNLNCAGNFPAPQIGDSQGSLNEVNGRKTGQCVVL
jgi:hypothetical protein